MNFLSRPLTPDETREVTPHPLLRVFAPLRLGVEF